MLKTASVSWSVWGSVLLLVTITLESKGSAMLASYSGSYTSLSANLVTDGVVSMRLSVGPMFADCDTAGNCTELARLNGLNWLDAGAQYLLDRDAIATAIGNGTVDIFSLGMNFGPAYSPALSGGTMGLFDSILDGSYSLTQVNRAIFTIDELLFAPVSTPFGINTEATLRYTLSLWDDGFPDVPGGEFPPLEPGIGEDTAPPVTTETPEPSTWMLLATGGLLGYRAGRSSRRL